MAPLAWPNCLGLPYRNHQLVLSCYPHQPGSHKLSLHIVLYEVTSDSGPIDRTPGEPGSDKKYYKQTAGFLNPRVGGVRSEDKVLKKGFVVGSRVTSIKSHENWTLVKESVCLHLEPWSKVYLVTWKIIVLCENVSELSNHRLKYIFGWMVSSETPLNGIKWKFPHNTRVDLLLSYSKCNLPLPSSPCRNFTAYSHFEMSGAKAFLSFVTFQYLRDYLRYHFSLDPFYRRSRVYPFAHRPLRPLCPPSPLCPLCPHSNPSFFQAPPLSLFKNKIQRSQVCPGQPEFFCLQQEP